MNDKMHKTKSKYIKNIIIISLILLIFLITIVFNISNNKLTIFTKTEFMTILTIFLFYAIVMIVYSIIITKRNTITKFSKSFLTVTKNFSSFLILLIIFLTVVQYFFLPAAVSGVSMEGSLHDGDSVLVSIFNVKPEKDDIVIIDTENYKELNDVDLIIKRVIATKGDVLELKGDNELFVNNESIHKLRSVEEFYVLTNQTNSTNKIFEITENKSVVLGDNRGISLDSRKIGLIDNDDIIGKALLKITPFSDFGSIGKDILN